MCVCLYGLLGEIIGQVWYFNKGSGSSDWTALWEPNSEILGKGVESEGEIHCFCQVMGLMGESDPCWSLLFFLRRSIEHPGGKAGDAVLCAAGTMEMSAWWKVNTSTY